MYSRSYYTDTDISVPENYDGTAFTSDLPEQAPAKIDSVKSELKFSPNDNIPKSEDESEECLSHGNTERSRGLFGFDFSGLFGGLFSGGGVSHLLPKEFGFEEILIIGIALFLLFSPSKDIECSLLLLTLIFIK